MPFRDSILEISPPFLLGPIGAAVQTCQGVVIDGLGDWMIEGVKAAMPGFGTPDALFLIGRDMQIDRGPNETDDHYIGRLQGAIDSHRIKGSGPELLRQLLAWFSPSTDTPLRLVSNQAVWHEINTTTEVVTKTVVGDNWTWDAFTPTRWRRGWVIIDSSVAPWTIDLWGDTGDWGDGGTWGSSMLDAEVHAIRRIVDKWKPAHIFAVAIIITFDATLFEVSDPSGAGENPDGTSDSSIWRAAYSAAFLKGIA